MALLNQLIPIVGIKGKFTVASPFDQLIPKTVDFEAVAVQEFKQLYADGVDPYELVYLPVALTKDDLKSDINLEVKIVTLMSASGINVKIPSRYITGMPNPADITYVNGAVVATLSAIPSTTNTSSLLVSISNLIENTLGIKPTVQLVKYGIEDAVTEVEHQSIAAARGRRITLATNPTKLAMDWQAKYNQEKTLRLALEKVIIKNGISL